MFQLMMVFAAVTGLIYVFTLTGPGESPEQGERDIRFPRAPAEASNLKNPFPNTPDIVAKGEAIYQGKGTCFTCHGVTGEGDGPAGLELRPKPRDFTNPKFHELRTDGELFWVIRNGTERTRMISYSPSYITEDEAWMVIHYLRTFTKKPGTG
ncbi:MAG TPA: c-type cytochrome [Nitrospiria bacterium]|nr:c-type cytochrome [Nitrospiria bacterium]